MILEIIVLPFNILLLTCGLYIMFLPILIIGRLLKILISCNH